MTWEVALAKTMQTLEEGYVVALSQGIFRISKMYATHARCELEAVFTASPAWAGLADAEFSKGAGRWFLTPQDRPIVVVNHLSTTDAVKAVHRILQKFDALEEDLVMRARMLKRERTQELCGIGRLGRF